MTDKDLTKMAEKVAAIIIAEEDKRAAELSEKVAQLLWNMPFDKLGRVDNK